MTSLALLTQQEASVFLRAGLLMAVGLILWVINVFLRNRLDREEAPES